MLTIPDNSAWEAVSAASIFWGAWQKLCPPDAIGIAAWAEANRNLSTEESSLPGRYSLDATPALRGVLAACDDPKYHKVVNQKPAQIGYTAGIVCNVIGYHVDHRPSVIVAVFPREKSAKDFSTEKLEPMVRNTKGLCDKIDLTSRERGQGMTRRSFPGGILKLVGSNSPADVKSTSARVVIIEEPDDAAADVRGQGDAIKMAEERAKTYPDHLILIGGTPTAKGASSIESEMRVSDQRRFWIACPHCAAEHSPEWAHVKIPTDPDDAPVREVYGHHRWEDAAYHCPHCGAQITEDERVLAIRRAAAAPPLYGWRPEAESAVAGFYANELLSIFDGSRVPVLARKYLEALHEMEEGRPEAMIVFWNSTLGIPWEYKGELPEEDELRARAEPYPEWTAPPGALVPLLTVDVQHDRLAVTCWVVGRGEEMWLAHWGEIYGQTVVPHQGAWVELEQLLTRTLTTGAGPEIPIAACAIDCSDGQTSDAAYAFVRRHHRVDRQVIAVKGASDAEGRLEIWAPPKAVDPNYRATKASRFGVKVHIVGTAKAKDLILGWAQEGGRVRLKGTGPGRMHWPAAVRQDFYEQLLSEIKVPSRSNPRRRAWKARTDRRNEALDCTVYALYLSRHLRLHLRRPHEWDLHELRFRQTPLDLFEEPPPEAKHATDDDGPDHPPAVDPIPAAPAEDPPPAADPLAVIAAARLASLIRNRKAVRHGR